MSRKTKYQAGEVIAYKSTPGEYMQVVKCLSRPWLCYLGIHRWLHIGETSLVLVAPLSECLRCHSRKVDYGYATMYSVPPPEGWNDYLEHSPLTAREKGPK